MCYLLGLDIIGHISPSCTRLIDFININNVLFNEIIPVCSLRAEIYIRVIYLIKQTNIYDDRR